MFVFEGRPNMNIAIITITELMATNKRFCPGLKRKEIVFASREKMTNLQGKETRWERISGGASENLDKHMLQKSQESVLGSNAEKLSCRKKIAAEEEKSGDL